MAVDFTQNQVAGVTALDGGNASGPTLSAGVGLLNILAGLLLVAAILTFVSGLITWALRLGMVGRDDGVAYMRAGVTMLFVLVAGLAAIRFVQFHTQIVLGIIAVIAVVVVGWIAVTFKGDSGEDEDKR